MQLQTPPGSARHLFAAPELQVVHRADGSLVLRSKRSLPSLPPTLGHWLWHWAAATPKAPFLAERTDDGALRQITYEEAAGAASAIGAALLTRRLDAATPILILAENGIDHALVMLGAMLIGHPVAPVSTAYARAGSDFGKLGHIARLIEPSLVFVDDAARYAEALTTTPLAGAEIVAGRGIIPDLTATPLAELLAGTGCAPLSPKGNHDTTAKVLFTSGSTGIPKGVITTHGMLLANQESLASIWPFLQAEPPRLVDWLPWSHTFGGSHNLNLVLRHGGFMLIDGGRPVPGQIERTVANLKDVSPTVYFNVPRGYAMLLDHLETDETLQTSFYDQLQLLFYAGAALPRPIWDRMARLSERVLGHCVPMTSSWGLSETAPLATSTHFACDAPGNIGLPVPGVEVKLAPVDGRLEIRCRGANVTPGYFRDATATAAAFDDEGWLRTGDAVRLADAADPEKGLVFDGRIAESFKLSSGTWVNVGVLRPAIITALAPLVEDCVITGHDGDEIGVLLFPSLAGLRQAAGGAEGGLEELVRIPAVVETLRNKLATYNRSARGSSEHIARAMLFTVPPSIDAGEITDKGYINQRAVLSRRATEVAEILSEPPGSRVIRSG